jgi:hypothetical protein
VSAGTGVAEKMTAIANDGPHSLAIIDWEVSKDLENAQGMADRDAKRRGRSEMSSRSNWAKDNKTFRTRRLEASRDREPGHRVVARE